MKIAILLLMLLPFVFAQNASLWDTRYVNVSTVTVNELIEVKTDFEKFNILLPGYEYEGKVNISVKFPFEALYGISTDKIFVFVHISGEKMNDSCTDFYFKDNNETIADKYIVLYCSVSNGNCSNSSVLSREIKTYFYNKKIAGVNCTNNGLIVNGSLYPFSRQLNETKQIENELANLLQQIRLLGINESEINEINEVKNNLAFYDTLAALKNINEATEKINRKIIDSSNQNKTMDENYEYETSNKTLGLKNGTYDNKIVKNDVFNFNADINDDLFFVFIGLVIFAFLVQYFINKRKEARFKPLR